MLVSAVVGTKKYVSVAAAAVLTMCCLSYPHFIRHPKPVNFEDRMLAQMRSLGALDRDGQVQCIDTVSGCATVMLRAERAMTTGALNGFLLFPVSASPQVKAERTRFLDALERRKPEFIVVTNIQWPSSDDFGYGKLANWPEFSKYLDEDYRVASELEGLMPFPIGDRIYKLKVSGPDAETMRDASATDPRSNGARGVPPQGASRQPRQLR